MGIQKDSGELLIFAYKNYKKTGDYIYEEDFIKESGWDPIRAHNAMNYLRDTGMLKVEAGFAIQRVYPEGIDIIENKEKFKHTFGFAINLGIFKFSWERKKK